MSAAPQLQAVAPGIVSLPDHEAHARTRLDANAWAYFSGGAADEITLQANRGAWDGIALWPRVLQPLAGGHTRVELLGRSLAHPILLAPMAYQRMAHPDGELASAHAAAAQGAGFILSSQATVSLEHVAQATAADPQRGPLWFQLYFQSTREQTLDLVQRAEAAGYEALVVTADAPVNGARDRERRQGFRLPPGISAVNLVPRGPAAEPGGLCGGLAAQAANWADLQWLASRTRLPILLKGVLNPVDARESLASGIQGLIVSNHGGRTLDTAVATAVALPRIVEAVDGRLPVLVDGGIRRGTDVLKAVALGASAVLVGRPAIWGLANAGAVGVAHVLRLLRDELEMAMALCGCPTLDRIPGSLLDPQNGGK